MPPVVSVIRLLDGRSLGFASYGDSEGVPCFGFHGIPGSRFEGSLFHEAALAAGVRLIEIDRPGMGLSDPAQGRSVASITADVRALADALAIDRFAVFGWSGGAPYALACAALLDERIAATVIASCPRPSTADRPTWRELTGFRRVLWRLGTRRAWPLVPVLWVMGLAVRAAVPVATRSLRRMPPEKRPPQEAVSGMHEAWRHGARQVAQDLHVVVRDWGFELAQVRGRVHLWHGLEDTAVPISMGRALAQRLADCDPHFVPGGHRVCVDHGDEVFAALDARPRR